MNTLFRLWSRKEVIGFARFLGEILLPVGIITAALNKTFGGWQPFYWFLLFFACLLLALCSELARLTLHLESKK